jgi:hypothetical protein
MVNTIEGVSENEEEFFMLSVPVKGCPDLQSALDRVIEDERIVSPCFAESLGRKIDTRKRARIGELPDFLVIHLKRFEYDLETWTRYKVNERFEFPAEFDFAPYTSHPDDGASIYRLSGVIVHDGHAEGGHYYSLVTINDRWFCFNDTEVSEFPQSHFGSIVYGHAGDEMSYGPSAYLLFYTRTGTEFRNCLTDREVSESIPSSLKQIIDNENKLHVHDEAVFALPITQFVLRHVTDLRVLLLYYTNVILHSKSSTWVSFVIDRIVNEIRTTEAVDFVLGFFANYATIIFTAFGYCQSEEILDGLSAFVCELLPRCGSNSSISLIGHFIDQI